MNTEQRTPAQIIGADALTQLIFEGYAVVPASRDEQAEVVGPNLYSLPSRMKWCQPGDKQDHRYFLVRFDDADRGDAVFTDETEARDFFGRANTSWNCYLLGALPAHPSPAVAAGGVTEERVEAAAREFLLHKGETPWRVTRRGAELWEDYAPAMRAALNVALAAGDEGIREGDQFPVTLGKVNQAIDGYVQALVDRQHGGVAQDRAFNAICEALGRSPTAEMDARRRPTPPSRGEGE